MTSPIGESLTTPEVYLCELVPLLRQISVGPCGMAIGGSYAKGDADALSDIDVYLFAEQVHSGPQRSELIAKTVGADSQVDSWGQDAPFVECGTDFWYRNRRVECWLRNSQEVERTITLCQQGKIRRDYVGWTVMGFFNYVLLADIRTMQIIEDPYATLARWKTDVATYPEPMRQSILHRFMREAMFWPENFHYRTAVERADIIYTSALVQRVVQAVIQVIFALNREYFQGEKRLAQALVKLPLLPKAFPVRLQALVSPATGSGVEQLREQRRELCALVAEVQSLVLAQGGTAED